MGIDVYIISIYGGLGQGLLYALVAIGIFLTFRMMKFPDLTCEGSFALGGAITMTLLFGGTNPILALIVAPICGGVAGFITGIIHTKLKIDGIVVGLLVTMALYSINIFIMGSSNITAPIQSFIFTPVRLFLAEMVGMEPYIAMLTSYVLIGLLFAALIITALHFLFKTSFGLSIRSTGSNEIMSRANGINTDTSKIVTLVISNALIAFAGALIAQQQSGASVTSGSGILIIGLASLVLGEVFTPKSANILVRLLCITAGSTIYFCTISLVIVSGLMTPDSTKLLTAIITLIALCAPKFKNLKRRHNDRT